MADAAAVLNTITALAALLAAWFGIRNRNGIRRVQLTINGRLDQLLESVKSNAHAAGEAVGRTAVASQAAAAATQMLASAAQIAQSVTPAPPPQ